MLQPIDLRIGNYVEVPGKGITQITNGIEIDSVVDQKATPIQLTAELLIALGFTQQGRSQTFEIKQNNFSYHLSTRRISIAHPGNTLWHTLTSRIEHVHQLQNIFYCIVGYDLVFKK